MEAFVYCWYNVENNKKYIGYHKGHVEDGYVSSSGNKSGLGEEIKWQIQT